MPDTLPSQVQRGLEEAERIEQSLAAPPEAHDEPVEDREPAPAPEPQPPAPAAQPPAPSEDDTWRARYFTLKGMYDADVPRLHARVKELEAELSAKPPAPEPPQEPPADAPITLTQKDIDEFGPDLIDVIKRAAVDIAGPQIAALQAEIKTLKATASEAASKATETAEAQGADRRQRYFTDLAKAVPDYAEINANQMFLDWLGQTDPLSGRIRQEFLDSAFQSFDVERTAKLFTTWKETTSPAPAPTPVDTAKTELDTQVQPGRPRASAPQVDRAPKTYTQAEITRFYTDMAKGLYKGREDEAARMEADIDAAAAEGRVSM